MPVTVTEPLSTGQVVGDLVAGIPLGLLRRDHLQALARVTERVVVTPWWSVVVPGGAGNAAALAEAGLVTSAEDPWAHRSACTGAPWCARTASPVTTLATETVDRLAAAGHRLDRGVHLVGCERRCGARSTDLVMERPADVDAVLAAIGVPA